MRVLQFLKNYVKSIAYVLFVILTQGWQALGVLAIALLNHRPWECVFILLGYIVGRKFFGHTYHAPTLTICTILTWVIFYFLTSAVPSFSISITMPCIFGIILAYASSVVSEYLAKEK